MTNKATVITTAEELAALPKYSVVIDGDKDVWQKRGDSWASYETAVHTSTRLARYEPFTVLYVGKKGN